MSDYRVEPLPGSDDTWLVFHGEGHFYVTVSNSGGYSVQSPQGFYPQGTPTHTAVSDAVHAYVQAADA